MKPSNVLWFVLAVLAGLAIISAVFPDKGIEINKNTTLYFPSIADILSSKNKNSDAKDSVLAEIIESNKDVFNDTLADIIEPEKEYIDSTLLNFKAKPVKAGTIKQLLELPNNNLECLKKIFDALSSGNELQKTIRILHYGDSQIETDRITGYLRAQIQAQFGGSGPGLVPAKTAYDYKSPVGIKNSENWKRYTIFPKTDTAVKHYRYGALASFCMFTQPRKPAQKNNAAPTNIIDSLATEDTTVVTALINSATNAITPENKKLPEIHNASLKFEYPQYSRANTRNVKQCKMYYGNCKENFLVKVFDGETMLFSDSVKASEYYSIKKWNFETAPQNLRMEFSATESPEIYCFAMDGRSGVAVDNVALRGCSGTIFTQMNSEFLKNMYSDMNVKLAILQFGGNTVPYLTKESVKNYKSMFSAQLRLLRRIRPDMSIIVIGPADMSTKVADEYQTYEVLPDVVEAMRQAAFANGCAFWDMYSAMGGENSMPSWVFNEPALAEKDFVHFTPNGANIMAKMFYSALIGRYNEYLNKK